MSYILLLCSSNLHIYIWSIRVCKEHDPWNTSSLGRSYLLLEAIVQCLGAISRCPLQISPLLTFILNGNKRDNHSKNLFTCNLKNQYSLEKHINYLLPPPNPHPHHKCVNVKSYKYIKYKKPPIFIQLFKHNWIRTLLMNCLLFSKLQALLI